MSGARTSSRHHERPSSARRHSRDDNDYKRHAEEQPSRSSTHRHRSSSGRNSPRKHHDAAAPEAHRFRPEDYILEDGVPPLRRQSTQPPHRRTSPTTHSLVAHRETDDGVYRRREVEPVSVRHPGTPPARPHRSSSSRHATPADPALSTALVVVEEKQISPRRHAEAGESRRHSARASPRRSSRHDSHIETEDGVVRSPRQHVSPTKTSPRRAHRQTGSPIRPERRAESSRHQAHRHASAEPRTRSPHTSARHHHDAQSARPAAAPEATHRQDTLRYRSPPLAEEGKRRSSSRQARRHSHAADEEPEKKRTSSAHRHESAHRSRSNRPSSRHDSERRHRHESRRGTASDDDSRRVRHASRRRQVSQDSSVAPRDPAQEQTRTEAMKGSAPPAVGSTYVRPNGNGHLSTRRSSGSYIEVISVNSARPGSSSSWLQPSPRRPREVGPPVVLPDPRGERIMQRIDSTRHWIKNMKEEVEKDRERELQAKREAEAAEAAEEKAARQREAEREAERARREERRRAEERRNGSTHHRSSSRGSHRRTRSAHDEANGAAPALVEPAKAVDSRRHPRAAVAPAAPPEKSRAPPVVEPQRSKTRSTHAPSASTHTAPSEREEVEAASSRRSTKRAVEAPVAAPAPAPAAAMHDTLNSSRKDGFDYPIFSFVSFLDGNTFDSTAGLCQYNTQVAEGLSDEHLDLLREVIFDHDEEAFAELLYGDDVQAEMDVIVNTLGHSEDPAVQREIIILQRAAVRRFNEKCSAALRTLLAAPGGLADAVQIAASQLEHQVYETGANSP